MSCWLFVVAELVLIFPTFFLHHHHHQCQATSAYPPFVTIGKICSDYDPCIGENEQCLIQKHVEFSCSYGHCACMDGYVYTAGACVKKIFLNSLDEPCGKTIGEVITVKNAGCYGFQVKCRPGYTNKTVNNRCVLRETPCSQWDNICPSDMTCHFATGRCLCKDVYKTFNDNLQQCVRREFGDACTADEQCQVEGNEWQGYTYSTGICQGGICVCREKQTVASYFDPVTHELKRKIICVRGEATVNVTKNSRCTTDPIFWSDREDTAICSEGHVCIHCPEDSTRNNRRSGTCRRALTYQERENAAFMVTSAPPLTTNGLKVDFVTEEISFTTSPRTTRLSSRTRSVFFPCEVPKFSNGKFYSMRGLEIKGVIMPGVQILLLCPPGYVVKNGANKAQCLINGNFSNALGVCQPKLTMYQNCLLPNVIIGMIKVDAENVVGRFSAIPGTVIELQCPGGYEVSAGPNQSTCDDNGSWTEGLGICQQIRNYDGFYF